MKYYKPKLGKFWNIHVVQRNKYLCSNNAQCQVRDEKGQKGWRLFTNEEWPHFC